MLTALEVLGVIYFGAGAYCAIGVAGHCFADWLERRTAPAEHRRGDRGRA